MLDQTNLLADIDECIARSSKAGTLISHKSDVQRVWDDNLQMNFVVRIAKSLAAKGESDQKQKEKPRFPFLPPFEEGLFVGDLDDDHRLLLNKFNVVNRHLLITSTEFKEQNSTMTAATMKQVIRCIETIGGLAFHNHGVESGASQPHFHVQVIPRCESDEVRDVPLTDLVRSYDTLFNEASTIDKFPFKHLVVRFRPDEFNLENVHQHYLLMLERLNLTTESSYNFLLTSEYMMIVPRQHSAYKNIGVNSVAYAGLMFVPTEENFQILQNDIGGPGQLLRQLAYRDC